jgi:hypothetical protein
MILKRFYGRILPELAPSKLPVIRFDFGPIRNRDQAERLVGEKLFGGRNSRFDLRDKTDQSGNENKLPFLADALWREPKERGPIAAVVGKLCDPCGSQAAEILDAAREAADRVNALRSADREGYVTAAAGTLRDFKAQASKLDTLASGAGKRAAVTIADCKTEIETIRKSLARDMSVALNLPGKVA